MHYLIEELKKDIVAKSPWLTIFRGISKEFMGTLDTVIYVYKDMFYEEKIFKGSFGEAVMTGRLEYNGTVQISQNRHLPLTQIENAVSLYYPVEHSFRRIRKEITRTLIMSGASNIAETTSKIRKKQESPFKLTEAAKVKYRDDSLIDGDEYKNIVTKVREEWDRQYRRDLKKIWFEDTHIDRVKDKAYDPATSYLNDLQKQAEAYRCFMNPPPIPILGEPPIEKSSKLNRKLLLLRK